MNGYPSPHLIDQATRVAELLDQGYSNRRIGEVMGVSGPRIAQIRQRLPALRAYLGNPEPTDRLRGHREQLWSLRRDALALAAAVRADLRELNEELQAQEIDRLLGLRSK
jgi:hypothetical protein